METTAEMSERWAKAIAEAGVMTEEQMRDTEVPWPDSVEELTAYIRSLLDRPHDYGTSVYAMSMAATAAFQCVARKLGVTGFQASCADMDILRRTRGFKWGRVLNYADLLYPQYCDDKHFPTWETIIRENAAKFAEMAREKLAEPGAESAHLDVLKHWRFLAVLDQVEVRSDA